MLDLPRRAPGCAPGRRNRACRERKRARVETPTEDGGCSICRAERRAALGFWATWGEDGDDEHSDNEDGEDEDDNEDGEDEDDDDEDDDGEDDDEDDEDEDSDDEA
jgi:hypothetical protein